jgi:putative transposase
MGAAPSNIYKQLDAAGVAEGRRDDLVGGGLRRSLKGIGTTRERIDYDARVLGSGEFVSELRRERELEARLRPALSLEQLVERVAAHYGVRGEEMVRRSRRAPIVAARAVVCYVGVRELGHRNGDVGKRLGMSSGGVSMAAGRGARIVAEQGGVVEQLLKDSK